MLYRTWQFYYTSLHERGHKSLNRINGGIPSGEEFLALAQRDRGRAAALVNRGDRPFAALFGLLAQIEALNLYGELNPRNKAAFGFCSRILTGLTPPAETAAGGPAVETFAQNANAGPRRENRKKKYRTGDGTHDALRWILLTGAAGDGLDDGYDRVIDAAAAHLTRVYRDSSVLGILVRLIFRRHRRGRYIHDLVWALFSSNDPEIFRLIAPYLSNGNAADAALAQKLLKHAGGENPNRKDYLTWYRENRPYLYFTGESFHMSSDPTPFAVNLGAKYLGKSSNGAAAFAENALLPEERQRLNFFGQLPENDRQFLADYSRRLHSRDRNHWDKWMANNVNGQLESARRNWRSAR